MTLILKPISQKSEEFWIVTIALLIAFMLAAERSSQVTTFGVVGNYLYWTCRILIEAAFFVATFLAVEKYLRPRLPEWSCYLLAVLLSLVPFTLAVTALDIIMGLPELGLDSGSTDSASRGEAFGLELFYLLDNHLILGALLLVPRLLLRVGEQSKATAEQADEQGTQADTPKDTNIPLTFLEALDPPMEGRICSMEAQEHYIHVTTATESRMVLHRFSDAMQQTPAHLGMQVHRSHWVAHSAVQAVVVEGQRMKLKLVCDKMIPVSRTFRAAVDGKYSV